MADNSVLPVSGGTETFANDDIGGVKHPRVKVGWGADGAYGDTSAANPLPTVLTAGTAAVGKLAANSGVDIGDVDVLTIAGVAPAFGDGAKGATVLRVVSATDDPIISAIAGNVAHDAADSGNGSKISAKAETSLKGITLVADADRTDLYADNDGVQFVKLNTSFADLITERVSNTDGASTAFSNFSAVASTRNYVTNLAIFRTDAGTSQIYVDFRDGTAGSILYSVPIPAGGGCVINSPFPFIKTSAATALAFDVSAATSTVFISAAGFQSKAG